MEQEELKVKIYDNWDLYLSTRQYPYIGRCIATSKATNSTNVLDMTLDERNEFFDKVLVEWNKVVSEAFKPDLVNVACLCNNYKHLHWQLVPRYAKPVMFNGKKFVDERFGHNYSPTPKKELPDELTVKIYETVKSHFH